MMGHVWVGTYLALICLIFNGGTYLALIRLIEWRDTFGSGHVWPQLPLSYTGTYLGRDIFGTNYLYYIVGHIWLQLPVFCAGTYLGQGHIWTQLPLFCAGTYLGQGHNWP